MHHRTHAVRLDADTCWRLARLQRGTGTQLRKIVNTLPRHSAAAPAVPEAAMTRPELVNILEHLIVGANGYVSLKQRGLL